MASLQLGLPFLNSSMEDFKKVVFTTSQMIKDGNANILFGIERDTQLEVDDASLTKYEVEKELFNKVVNMEFIPILETILEESDEDFIAMQVRQYTDNKDKKNNLSKSQYEENLQRKVDYIKDVVVDKKIINRYIIKATTKHPKIKDISWEINKKIYEKNANEVNSNYATINIKVAKELGNTTGILKLFPFIQSEAQIEDFTFDCDENDINYLIKILNGVKSKLIKCE